MPASNYLVGTAPDQVPSNADLGEMAFQSKDAVEFTGGKGGLSHLDVTAISALLNVTATDVFVYDTSKDSDGGAWRNRCQHTSWYNETLNTATRGSRREFPSVAVIVATTTSITIYDGDDPTLPMWMVFTGGSAGLASTLMLQNGNSFCVAAMNAVMVTGVATNTDNWGSPVINFVSEKVVRMDPNSTEGGTWLGAGIAARNTTAGYASQATSGGYITINSQINDVAMTVLPNAPIDAATGLPIPTIAVATEGGVSVVNNDGSVANLINEDPNYTFTRYIQFNQKRQLQFVMDAVQRYLRTFNPPFYTRTVSQWGAQYDDGITVGLEIPQFTASASYIRDIAENAIGTDLGVEVFFENTSSPTASLYAYIAAKYNSGWLVGDTKGAWLSDTTQETIVGSELITNGDFASNLSGWTGSGTTAPSISSGGVLLTTGAVDGEVFQSVSALQPRFWLISWTVTSNSGGFFGLYLNQSAAQTGGFLALDGITTSGTYQYYGSITSIAFRHRSSSSGVIDNISLRPGDPDRSANGKGLQVFGSVTKTPVATGADLVAYSGFSSSNYFKQPPNAAMDFGSGSYSVMLWAKNTALGCAVGRGPNDSNESMNVYFDPATYGIYFDYGSAAQYVYAPSIKTIVNDGNWHFVVCHVTAGSAGVIWVDGNNIPVLNGGGVASNPFLNNASWELYVGTARQPDQPLPFAGSLALVRVSATVPSPEQIAKMYNDEKVLFQDNAKATLYGTSDAVTALAYDEDTQLLHVGTSSGRSVFDGLRRVDNTTTAVSATISAANGLVVEN